MNRRNQILSGLVVLQVVIIAVLFWPRQGANASVERLFNGVTLDDIQAITIQQGEASVHVSVLTWVKLSVPWLLVTLSFVTSLCGIAR